MKKFQKIFGVFEKRRIAPRKGGKHHQLSNEKGGENVEPNSREFYKQCAFQKFCNTVLHNEACDTHRELRRHKAKEVTFSDMTLDEARQLHTFDENDRTRHSASPECPSRRGRALTALYRGDIFISNVRLFRPT